MISTRRDQTTLTKASASIPEGQRPAPVFFRVSVTLPTTLEPFIREQAGLPQFATNVSSYLRFLVAQAAERAAAAQAPKEIIRRKANHRARR